MHCFPHMLVLLRYSDLPLLLPRSFAAMLVLPPLPLPCPVIVKSSSGPRYVVGCRTKVDKTKLTPNTRVVRGASEVGMHA